MSNQYECCKAWGRSEPECTGHEFRIFEVCAKQPFFNRAPETMLDICIWTASASAEPNLELNKKLEGTGNDPVGQLDFQEFHWESIQWSDVPALNVSVKLKSSKLMISRSSAFNHDFRISQWETIQW